MKLFVFALVIMAASAFAVDGELGSRHAEGSGMISIDGLCYSQHYDFGNLSNGYSNWSGADRWVADDFELTNSNYIDSVVVWMIWTGGMGSDFNLVFSEDAGDSDPNNATHVWAENTPCTNVFTGDQNWGYDIYETTCSISPTDVYPLLDGGVHYWLETQAVTYDNCFILVGTWSTLSYVWWDDGSGVWVRSDVAFGEETDMFFDLNGFESALESATWADIKTLF